MLTLWRLTEQTVTSSAASFLHGEKAIEPKQSMDVFSLLEITGKTQCLLAWGLAGGWAQAWPGSLTAVLSLAP